MDRPHTDVARAGARAAWKTCRPRLEIMEGRQLLSTFSVTTTADSGAGSLRAAIDAANAAGGADVIDFHIGTGPKTIAPTTALPQITDPVTIDGTTQTGYAGAPIIQLNGASAGSFSNTNGLSITAPNCTVRGLVINRFSGAGIALVNTGGDVIEGNYIGTDLTGTVGLGNNQSGILLVNARNNFIGGPTLAQRNIIASNGSTGVSLVNGSNNNTIQGNWIGIDAAGSIAGNNGSGVYISQSRNNLVGGAAAGQGNVVSGNAGDGVLLYYNSDGNRVQGNFIGTDETKAAKLGNLFRGVAIYASGNFVGEVDPKAGNVITNNRLGGVLSTTTGNSILSNSIFGNPQQQITLYAYQPTPRLTQAYMSGGDTVIQGKLLGSPNTGYTLQFFSSRSGGSGGTGQGEVFLETVQASTNASGVADIAVTLKGVDALDRYITATSTDANNTTSQFSSPVKVASGPAVDLILTKVAAPNPVDAGTDLTYTLYVSNQGPGDANEVRVVDNLPPNVTYSSSASSIPATIVQANGTVVATIPRLHQGEQAVITIVAIPTRAGLITNKAFVTAAETDVNPNNNASSADVFVLANTIPPAVVDQGLILTPNRKAIGDIVLSFSKPLETVSAQDLRNYNLRSAGRDRKFNTADDVIISLASAKYSTPDRTVRLTPKKSLAIGPLYELKVNGPEAPGLTDLAGNLLSGNAVSSNIPGLPNGVYATFVGRGTHLRPDANPALLGLPQFNLPFTKLKPRPVAWRHG